MALHIGEASVEGAEQDVLDQSYVTTKHHLMENGEK
jgi:hypothetical protein